MKLTEELQSLSRLHQEGSLSDTEFAQAKKKLLSQTGLPGFQPPAPRPDNDNLGRAVRAYVTWYIASSIVGGLIFLYIFLNYILPVMVGHNSTAIQFTPIPK